ncbi:hypothetical protein DXT68_11265 [Microbacterium foliorum]|uniref:Uncharacterized protein n=1 Tax=Microbacterium foliorum TaxID=104336 RepID=A0A0F0KV67_9MICO|nr:hypothetical protein [Microbacterium foliorum]AXL12655.1 hypothetical protein DXT68_11265 [Microbacterium foliorum]KJL23146.1 hypothetical protein RN50_01084 [Microbacterium foliorum]
MITIYKTLDNTEMLAKDAPDLPIGSTFTIEYSGRKRAVLVTVMRTEEDEWLAWRMFGAQAPVFRLGTGLYDARQAGYSARETLGEAIYTRFGPFILD